MTCKCTSGYCFEPYDSTPTRKGRPYLKSFRSSSQHFLFSNSFIVKRYRVIYIALYDCNKLLLLLLLLLLLKFGPLSINKIAKCYFDIIAKKVTIRLFNRIGNIVMLRKLFLLWVCFVRFCWHPNTKADIIVEIKWPVSRKDIYNESHLSLKFPTALFGDDL